jgi:Raf kinase inhibitor-like YbhB/YbcL family protein
MYGKTAFALSVAMLVACAGDSDGETTTTGSDSTGGSEATTSTEGTTTTSTTEGSGSTGVDGSTTEGSTGGSSGGVDSTGAESTGMVEFTLTSDAFVEGGGIPGIHHVAGGNQSPPLEWVGAPAGTMSFAVFFHDETIMFDHSAIWDIPAEVTSLPQDVDHTAMPADVPGAVQCDNWKMGTEFGYGGPGSDANFYVFTLYAIDVATIPEIDENSTRAEVRAALEDHSLGTATLMGQSTGP